MISKDMKGTQFGSRHPRLHHDAYVKDYFGGLSVSKDTTQFPFSFQSCVVGEITVPKSQIINLQPIFSRGIHHGAPFPRVYSYKSSTGVISTVATRNSWNCEGRYKTFDSKEWDATTANDSFIKSLNAKGIRNSFTCSKFYLSFRVHKTPVRRRKKRIYVLQLGQDQFLRFKPASEPLANWVFKENATINHTDECRTRTILPCGAREVHVWYPGLLFRRPLDS